MECRRVWRRKRNQVVFMGLELWQWIISKEDNQLRLQFKNVWEQDKEQSNSEMAAVLKFKVHMFLSSSERGSRSGDSRLVEAGAGTATSSFILPFRTGCWRHTNIRAWEVPSWHRPVVCGVKCCVPHATKGYALQREPKNLGTSCCFPAAFRNLGSGMLEDTSWAICQYPLVDLFLNLSCCFWSWWYHIPPF